MRIRIKDMREDNDKTQKQIADYLRCDQSLYSKYERGERDIPLKIMIELGKYYETSIDYLVGLTDEKEAYKRGEYYIWSPRYKYNIQIHIS